MLTVVREFSYAHNTFTSTVMTNAVMTTVTTTVMISAFMINNSFTQNGRVFDVNAVVFYASHLGEHD